MDEGLALLLGLVLGFALGFLVARSSSGAGSVVFERDREGRVVAIHYVPGGGR